jgi:hypothetical protein
LEGLSTPQVEPGLHVALSRHLVRIARRALLWRATRALSLAAATLSFLLLSAAWLCGPSLSTVAAVSVWLLLPSSALAAFGFALGSTKQLHGSARARLLEPFDASLARRVQSAAELVRAPNGSPALIHALATSVGAELEALPLGRAIAKPKGWGELTLGGVLVALLAALLLMRSEDAQSGLYAILHPGLADASGAPVGLWIEQLQVDVQTPQYLGSEESHLDHPQQIEVPAGSRISLRLRARLAASRVVMALGDRTLPFTRVDPKTYVLDLTAETSGVMNLRARVQDEWVTDPASPKLHVIADAAPVVMLDAPTDDRNADVTEPVPFVYRVRDDHGLAEVDLVVQLAPRRERRIAVTRSDQEGQKDFADSTHVTPADFGVQAGASFNVWIEARDRDAFKGPNVGRSPIRRITVSSISNPRGAPIALVTEARDHALDTLGKRLETDVPEKQSEVAQRAKQLSSEARPLVKNLETLASAYAKSTGDQSTADTLRDMVRRFSRLGREERDAAEHSDKRAWNKTHEALVSELEDDVVWLTDLIGRARLADAQHVLGQLESTRARMRALLDELKNSSDPARKQELLNEIERARAELRELSQRLLQAQGDVPSDFVNYDALAEHAAENPLDAMQRALESGDMAAAERALADLDSQLEGLRGGLGEGQQAFANARISPRQRALSEARSEIDQLTRAQQSLANETARAAQGQSQGNTDSAFREAADKLAEQAEALEQRSRELKAGRSQPQLAEAQSSAAQRLRDARDALKRGDAAEARAMARRAAGDLRDISAEMSLDARMYPGPDGSRMTAAREASSLAKDTRSFAEDVEENLPAPSDETSPEQARALQDNAGSQKQLGQETRRVAHDLDQSAPPGLRDGLERVQKSMRGAAEAMEQGDSRETQGHQRDALDRLTELSERLREEQEALGGQARASDGEGDGRQRDEEKVTIPGQSDDPRRTDLRRRVLDARRARSPESYEKAIERYYQEILR